MRYMLVALVAAAVVSSAAAECASDADCTTPTQPACTEFTPGFKDCQRMSLMLCVCVCLCAHSVTQIVAFPCCCCCCPALCSAVVPNFGCLVTACSSVGDTKHTWCANRDATTPFCSTDGDCGRKLDRHFVSRCVTCGTHPSRPYLLPAPLP